MEKFFYGWYLKCQSDTQTLAVIPAVHQAGQKRSYSIQVITDSDAWNITFPAWTFLRRGTKIFIGDNLFDERGVKLSLNTQHLQVEGKLKFGPLTPLKYDIMGPFALVPFMECRHSVFSMRHVVNGSIFLNGEKLIFNNAIGYWEGDQGRSFPREYLWTQCHFKDGSLMLSVADIPIFGRHFTGIIGVVLWKGKEYRLATYLGAKIKYLQKGMVRIVQRDMELEACLLEKDLLKVAGKGLRAPVQGEMTRTIHEKAACHARYRFQKKNNVYLTFETGRASFEYEYRR